METLFSILVIAALLVLSTFLLHRQQQKSARELAERSAPLQEPELNFDATPKAATAPNASTETSPSSNEPTSGGWQEQARSHRENAEFEAALACCQAHYPRVEAFRQALITHRAQLRRCQQRGESLDVALKELYRTAVLADLLRPALLKGGRRAPSERLIDSALHNLNINYRQIGYRQLRLLSKTDRRLLVAHWGEPDKHCHAELSVGVDWQNQLQLFSN